MDPCTYVTTPDGTLHLQGLGTQCGTLRLQWFGVQDVVVARAVQDMHARLRFGRLAFLGHKLEPGGRGSVALSDTSSDRAQTAIQVLNPQGNLNTANTIS
jgi:hypothetical protein